MDGKTLAWLAGGVALAGVAYYLVRRSRSAASSVPPGFVDTTPNPDNVVNLPVVRREEDYAPH